MSNEDRKAYERLVASFKLSDLPVKKQFGLWRLSTYVDVEAVTQLKTRVAEWIGACFADEATVESVSDDSEFRTLDDHLKKEVLRICLKAKDDPAHTTLARMITLACEEHRQKKTRFTGRMSLVIVTQRYRDNSIKCGHATAYDKINKVALRNDDIQALMLD